MSKTRNDQQTAQVEITNIGGIDHSSLTLNPGVNVLSGKNATNRTSFLQALMAVCGSEQTTVKADAEHGEVTLSMGEKRYSFDGEPYLDDPILADLFAFLLENNEARQAVARGDNLRESEREITGLVFALAGYLVREVYDHVPFMLLDSIEAVDSDRIARLVDYLASYSDYLVVALLEEDAQALDDSYPRIKSI
jgi:recombinational DNA repair ATPase RecF